jgi:hypothetical protein
VSTQIRLPALTFVRTEDAVIPLEVDGVPVPLQLSLRFGHTHHRGTDHWTASATLPQWMTPSGSVLVQGIGADRSAAIEDALMAATAAVARYETEREVERRLLR